MNAFKAYDIRGIYNKDFQLDDVYRIGYYLPLLMKTNKVLVGRDIRHSSPEIFDVLCRGITDQGAFVYDAGLATTPMIYFLTAKEGFSASVMITASHNDKEYNGMKISGYNAIPVGYEDGLKELEYMIRVKPKPSSKPGKILAYNKKDLYYQFLKTYQPSSLPLKLAVDCSNGMAGLFAKNLFRSDTIFLNQGMDGDFPGHPPNPLVEENLKDLKATVLTQHLDLGIIFDGDADRVMFVDEKGHFIRPDLIIALLGDYFLKDHPNSKALFDIRSSRVVREHLEKSGAKTYMWRVGRAFAAKKLKAIDGLFGGELAGHYYFKDFYYSDSGLMAALIALQVFSSLKNQGVAVSSYFDQLNYLHNSGEVNFKIDKKTEAMEAIKDFFVSKEKPVALYDFDGYRIEFKDWWFNVRPSNTEPYLRFIAEAETQEKLEITLQKVQTIIKKYH
ncbi:MAG: phosphomannomutase/phosphoglucomutase [Bacteroidales bacterium]